MVLQYACKKQVNCTLPSVCVKTSTETFIDGITSHSTFSKILYKHWKRKLLPCPWSDNFHRLFEAGTFNLIFSLPKNSSMSTYNMGLTIKSKTTIHFTLIVKSFQNVRFWSVFRHSRYFMIYLVRLTVHKRKLRYKKLSPAHLFSFPRTADVH